MPIFTQNEINLHTHSFYCGHGTGTLKDYIAEAFKNPQLKVLGFSEHCQTPDEFYADRMRYDVFEDYVEDAFSLKNTEGLTVLCGAECDWNPSYTAYYRYLKERMGLDYILGSVHYYRDRESGRLRYYGKCLDVTPYLSDYVSEYTAMLRSGLFLIGCHPDLYCYHTEWNSLLEEAAREIISTAKETGMILEINGCGFQKKHIREDGSTRHPYPVPEFWKIVREEGVRCCINSDAHHPAHLISHPAFAFASENGLEDLLVKWEISDEGIRAVL
ncbi:MAG: histidinol-phosphatase [Sphaerochaetaceae bacterium]|nr:histidinol-phosphatase [Sphaerochaetaceae bacterium]